MNGQHKLYTVIAAEKMPQRVAGTARERSLWKMHILLSTLALFVALGTVIFSAPESARAICRAGTPREECNDVILIPASPVGLELLWIRAEKTEDSEVDETYLLVNGRRVFRQDMGASSYWDLTSIEQPFYFDDTLKIVLKDEDWPDKDDTLGSVELNPIVTQGVLTFDRDGARYKLGYRTTPAAFLVCDGGEGVYLYRDSRHGGYCTKLNGSGSIAHLDRLPIGNDQISSIKIVGCFGITLFEHWNFRGSSETFRRGDLRLSDNHIGNDTASSLDMWPC